MTQGKAYQPQMHTDAHRSNPVNRIVAQQHGGIVDYKAASSGVCSRSIGRADNRSAMPLMKARSEKHPHNRTTGGCYPLQTARRANAAWLAEQGRW